MSDDTEKQKSKIEEFKAKVEEKVENNIEERLNKKAIELEKKLEFKTRYNGVENEFSKLKELDADMVNEFSNRYKEASSIEDFNNFQKEYDMLFKVQERLLKQEESIVSPKFNTSFSNSSHNYAKDTKELIDLAKEGYQIPYYKSDEGLYLTQKYLDYNEKIKESIDNFKDNYYQDKDIENIKNNHNELVSSCLRESKYYQIV
jgi:hypothetical protein